MIASEMLSTRSTYSPKRASDSLETPKFEPYPRSRRSAFEQDSPSSTVDLSTYQANQVFFKVTSMLETKFVGDNF